MCSIIVRNKLTLLKEICWILKIIVEHLPSVVILVSLRVVLTLSVPWTIVEVSIIIIILVRVSVLRVLITGESVMRKFVSILGESVIYSLIIKIICKPIMATRSNECR